MRNYVIIKRCLLECFIIAFFIACNSPEKQPLFTTLTSGAGINFTNTLTETDSLNILQYIYFYNGGGVAVGDINNDGLEDIYFISNQGSNKLYLNKGGMKFEDITTKAGVQGKGNWKTGVTMADVNGDGLLDIYVSEVGGYKGLHGHNELFINHGNLTFTEEASEYGLDVESFNTQAVFFDYDRDGDLDCYIVNHSVHYNASYGDTAKRSVKDEMAGDKLLRNDIRLPQSPGGKGSGTPPTPARETAMNITSSKSRVRSEAIANSPPGGGRAFVDVTLQAGISSSALGYGLNVIVNDFNADGWPDIYVSNDFHENDYYYVNQRNGTFVEKNKEAFGHESRFSMGSDAADVNNDGWPDMITLDMLAQDETVLHSSVSDDPLDIYRMKLAIGYSEQFSKNSLQLNLDGGRHFSDVSLFAGVAATDWSWSPLLADFDNDGIKDIFISNGIMRRPNDLDYVKYSSDSYFGGGNQRSFNSSSDLEKMPEGKVHNYFFKGSDSLHYSDVSTDAGFGKPNVSTGAAYADLDNDGDLDIVVNNLNEPAAIYQNNTQQNSPENYVAVKLKGEGANSLGIGATIRIWCKRQMQSSYVTATRGFESSSSVVQYFGLRKNKSIDSMVLQWPDGKQQRLMNVGVNQTLVLQQSDAKDTTTLPSVQPIFTDITADIGLNWTHHENDFTDFNVQAFIPHELSTSGPATAVGDINGDGLDDLYLGGAKWQSGALFIQTKEGKLLRKEVPAFAVDSICEDVDAIFFDADNDGDKDLYVVSGGNEWAGKQPALLDRLYINDGKGAFTKGNGLPKFYGNKSCVVAGDIDHDNDEDLIVGGRVVAHDYGAAPSSYILLNDGKGNFTEATTRIAPGLQTIGMVTGAVFTDIDNDGWKDLALVGEWMPLTIYKNNHGFLQNATASFGTQSTSGWWTCLQAADVNGDGYEDLLAGNWGTNSKLHASQQYPLRLYVGNVDGVGESEPILTLEKGGNYYCFLGKDEMERQLPQIFRKPFPTYASAAGKTAEQIFGNDLSNMKKLEAVCMESSVFYNGDGKSFQKMALPKEAQWSPVFGFAVDDFNGDGKPDILCGGNFYGVIPYEGRYDASYGWLLASVKHKGFTTVYPLVSGLTITGEVRYIKKINIKRDLLYCFARNNDKPLFFRATVQSLARP